MAIIDRDSIRRRVSKGGMPIPRCIICGRQVVVSGDDWGVVYRGKLRCVICKECKNK